MNAIMKLAAEETNINLDRAQKALKENAQRASYILRELTLKGKLDKSGRGKAGWSGHGTSTASPAATNSLDNTTT